MKALLLAAGRSKRVKPIEDKNFLKFCGKYLVQHQVESLGKAGFEKVIIMGGEHNIPRLKELFSDIKFPALKIMEQKNLDHGMAGAIIEAEEVIGDDPVLIVGGNDVVEQKAYDLMVRAGQGEADAYLLAYKVKEYFPGGYLRVGHDAGHDAQNTYPAQKSVDEDLSESNVGLENTQKKDFFNNIRGIVEKPGEGKEPSDMVNIVLHLYKKPQKLIETLKETRSDKDDRYEVALDGLMEEMSFVAVPYRGFWQPVKFSWHVLDLMKEFLENSKPNIDPSVEIAESAIIRGNVSIGRGSKIFDNAVIQGPAYIGENCVVANNAMLRASMTGDNCVIGFGTEVARSFIGDDCWFHSNYVGDTVMGNDVTFGGGAVCANLRLDEKEIGESKRNKLGPVFGNKIRVGVQTSIMPGVKIGSDTMITSGLVIAEDISAGKFVKGKTSLEIKDNLAKLDKSARDKMKKKL